MMLCCECYLILYHQFNDLVRIFTNDTQNVYLFFLYKNNFILSFNSFNIQFIYMYQKQTFSFACITSNTLFVTCRKIDASQRNFPICTFPKTYFNTYAMICPFEQFNILINLLNQYLPHTISQLQCTYKLKFHISFCTATLHFFYFAKISSPFSLFLSYEKRKLQRPVPVIFGAMIAVPAQLAPSAATV